MGMYRDAITPDNFKVPLKYSGNGFELKPLTIASNESDFKAVNNNVDRLGKHLNYPKHSKEQNLIDLGYHQKEMQKKASFTYTITRLGDTKNIGCLYIYPSDRQGFEVEVTYWLTREGYERGLYSVIDDEIKVWLEKSWPFKSVYFQK